MQRDRLGGVAMLSIEQEVAKQINVDNTIEQLAVKKVCLKL